MTKPRRNQRFWMLLFFAVAGIVFVTAGISLKPFASPKITIGMICVGVFLLISVGLEINEF